MIEPQLQTAIHVYHTGLDVKLKSPNAQDAFLYVHVPLVDKDPDYGRH